MQYLVFTCAVCNFINKEENTKPKLSTRSALKVKYKIHDINFLKTLDNSTFNVINDNLEMKFYSFENALDFSLKCNTVN